MIPTLSPQGIAAVQRFADHLARARGLTPTKRDQLVERGVLVSGRRAGLSVSIVPTRDVTSTRWPSLSPRRAASSGCSRAVQRSAPFIRRGLLCIHELLLRS